MTAAFSVAAHWPRGRCTSSITVDARLSQAGHVSLARLDDVEVVVFGTLLGLAEQAPALDDADRAAALYRERGTDWLGEVAGDWAIVIVDTKRDELRVARNVSGTRPVFVRQHAGRVLIGSTYSSTEPVCSALDAQNVARLLGGQPPEPGRTLLEDVRSVRPGHVATWTATSSKEVRYWHPDAVPPLPHTTLTEAAGPLRELIKTVVTEHADRADGILGMHLTGGIDSAIVAVHAVAQRRAAKQTDPAAFCWQPATAPGAEPTIDQQLVADMATLLDVPCHPCPSGLDVGQAVLALDPAIEPATSTLRLETPVVDAARRVGVSTIISGWGGDEFASFNGRHRHSTRLGRLRKALSAVKQRRRRRQDMPQGYASRALAQVWSQPKPRPEPTARSEMISLLEAGGLAERADSWSIHAASAGIQYSFPLLDRRIIEFVLGLPGTCFPAGREMFRQAIVGDVPESVRLNRNKREPSRSNHTRHVTTQLVEAWGSAVPVRTDRLQWVDANAMLATITATVESGADLRHPGKLLNALQLLFDPNGQPLSSAATQR